MLTRRGRSLTMVRIWPNYSETRSDHGEPQSVLGQNMVRPVRSRSDHTRPNHCETVVSSLCWAHAHSHTHTHTHTHAHMLVVTGRADGQSFKRPYYQTRLSNQALLKAKYCPRVAAALCIQKSIKKFICDLDLWPMTLKSNRVLKAVEAYVPAKFRQAMRSGSWVINSELDFGHVSTSIANIYGTDRAIDKGKSVINYDYFLRSTTPIWWTLVH